MIALTSYDGLANRINLMKRSSENTKAFMRLSLKTWLYGFVGAAFVFAFALMRLDSFTEMTPDHRLIRFASFIVMAIVSLICGFTGWRLAASGQLGRKPSRSKWAIGLGLAGCMIGLSLVETTDLIEGWIDFPASETHRSMALIPISGAYEIHGRGVGWYIQTRPGWSNLAISYRDYAFMQTHQLSVGSRAKEIASNGYFCAHVTLEQARNAIRVIHNGFDGLPQGSIIICPNRDNHH